MFLVSSLLKFFYPTSFVLLLLLMSATLKKRQVASRVCFWLAIAILLICGNGWVANYSTRHLERQYSVLGVDAVRPGHSVENRGSITNSGSGQVHADCILVLGGGTLPKVPPRPTVEVAEGGNRVLYGAHLYHEGKAPLIICTGRSIVSRTQSEAEDMAELLQDFGVPKNCIMVEPKAENTYQHTIYVEPLLRERGVKRVLLVTSAMHMPRAMLVFRKNCPEIDFLAAPTDFRVAPLAAEPWYQQLVQLVPVPANMVLFTEALHEYFGIVYYRLRGWI